MKLMSKKKLIHQLTNSGITLTDSEAALLEEHIYSKQTVVGNRYYENARATAAIRTGVPS